jgi:arginine N-succinyltransferase
MFVMRPVKMSDLDQLVALADQTSFGLTTLPKDRKLLEGRIRDAEQGFGSVEAASPRGETFLFVVEDLRRGRLVGTCGVVSKVGGFQPFYAYRIEDALHESKMLNVSKKIPTLHLVADHDGPCEIGSLFLSPDYRGAGIGRFLSLGRFLFMAQHLDRFDPEVIAEMRGVIDENGHSVFWDALGQHFFEIDFTHADYLSIVDKKFIADLMPKHPIYIPLLPPDAQAVIGQVHEYTRPALSILEKEGFEFNGLVDIFEAGPVVTCHRDRIRSVRESFTAAIDQITDETFEAPDHVIARTDATFLACKAPLQIKANCALRIDRATALTLGVREGDTVRAVKLRADKPKEADAKISSQEADPSPSQGTT